MVKNIFPVNGEKLNVMRIVENQRSIQKTHICEANLTNYGMYFFI